MVNINNQNSKIAIVGININWESCPGIDEFERLIYEGKHNNIPLPSNTNTNKIIQSAIEDASLNASAKIAIINVNEKIEFNQVSFTHKSEKTVFNAIKTAQKLLVVREVDAVIIVADAAALVLKLDSDARKNQQRIYATIEGLTVSQNASPTVQTVTQTCASAFNIAGIKPEDIGYLEICSDILEPNQSEITGLATAYQTAAKLTCAVGSVKTNIGNTAATEIASLIKTALCIYYYYIPAVPKWSIPKYPELWQSSPFYVDTQSKPWFLAAEANKRYAAINSFSNGNLAHLILSSAPQQQRDSRYLAQMPYYLFPLAADESSELLKQIEALEKTISESDSLADTAAQTFVDYQKNQNAAYAVAILGRNPKELHREIQRALKGVKDALLTGGEWKTPVGSCFTANPLGKKGKVAFVYPGAYSSYVGIARNLFRLFPKIWDSPIIQSVYSRVASIEKFLYPRSLNALTKRQLEDLEQQLIDNPLSMLESEVGIAGLISTVLSYYFKLQPDCCFGYSVGETTMAIAQGIWTDFSPISSGLNSSQLFTTRLSGSKNAVREYWGLDEQTKGEFWRNYVLMAEVSQVKEHLKKEQRVYLTQINTSKEVIIAGEPAACQRVIDAIGCNAIAAPFNHVIHCEAMASEYDEFVKLHTLPINGKPKIDFYTASEYGQLQLDSEVMGKSIAKVLCEQFDFPRIVNRLYDSGVRIFVEVGAGNACSRWIGENLKGREHTALFLNRRGIDEHTTLLRGLAQLFSHRVQIDLSPLYNLNSQEESKPSIEKNIWENLPQPVIYNSNHEKPSKKQEEMITVSPHYWGHFSMQELQTSATLNYPNINDINLFQTTKSPIINEKEHSYKTFSEVTESQINTNSANTKTIANFIQNNAKQIGKSNLEFSQSQALFLKARKSSFNQMVKMVELQLSILGESRE